MKRKLSLLILVFVYILTISVNAASGSVSTTEFGTVSYELNATRAHSSICRCPCPYNIVGKTQITNPKPTTTVYITFEIRDKVNGNLLQTPAVDTNTGGSIAQVSRSHTPDRGETVIVYSCHEARGNSSVAKYLATDF